VEFYDYVVADVFTETRFEGNPVAVFLDAQGLSTEKMQRIAREMHLSETTFVLPAEFHGDAKVRIFTPVNELPFAGHPILGTVIVLAEIHAGALLQIETGMGVIPLFLDRSGSHAVSARMKQPVPVWEPYDQAHDLLSGLGIASSTLPVEEYRNGPRHVYVGLPDIDALSAVQPDLRMLARLPDMAANCFAGNGNHWRMRMFSPAYGVSEDAATGSAAGPLAIHLARYGLISFNQRIEIAQGVEMGRPSLMIATAFGSPGQVDSVEVEGSAVVVARGVLQI
jgi:trans-2,3-dihydro-3-hydroxyanthranilate isomerase